MHVGVGTDRLSRNLISQGLVTFHRIVLLSKSCASLWKIGRGAQKFYFSVFFTSCYSRIMSDAKFSFATVVGQNVFVLLSHLFSRISVVLLNMVQHYFSGSCGSSRTKRWLNPHTLIEFDTDHTSTSIQLIFPIFPPPSFSLHCTPSPISNLREFHQPQSSTLRHGRSIYQPPP